MDGGWVDGCGDVHEVQIRYAAGDLDIADVAYEREVRVVDGDGELRLIVERRGGGRRRRRLRRDADAGPRCDAERQRDDQRNKQKSWGHVWLLSRRTEPWGFLAGWYCSGIQNSEFKIQTGSDSKLLGVCRFDTHPDAATTECLNFEF